MPAECLESRGKVINVEESIKIFCLILFVKMDLLIDLLIGLYIDIGKRSFAVKIMAAYSTLKYYTLF